MPGFILYEDIMGGGWFQYLHSRGWIVLVISRTVSSVMSAPHPCNSVVAGFINVNALCLVGATRTPHCH